MIKIFAILMTFLFSTSSIAVADVLALPTNVRIIHEAYGRLPLSFIENYGQVDERVRFYEKGAGHTTFFTDEGIYLSLARRHRNTSVKGLDEGGREDSTSNILKLKPALLKLSPVNANKGPEISTEGLQEGRINYFIGNDPKKWKVNIPTYRAVLYKEVYRNIDVRFYGNNSRLEYDIIVKPGADPSVIRFSYEGIESLKVTEEGDLEIAFNEDSLVQKAPYVYQDIDGKRVIVEGAFTVINDPLQVQNNNSKNVYGFKVASYNRQYSLIIDPVLDYSTFLGGSSNDFSHGIAVDSSGDAYVTGWTLSTNFPTASPFQADAAGNEEAFITKINATGTALVYSTYLGGASGVEGASADERGYGIAVDTAGNAYVTGQTFSNDFPTTGGAYQNTNAGLRDAFVTKLNTAGSALVYSTYLGGTSYDAPYDIAVDSSGNAYITGVTSSTDFPTASPFQGDATGDDAFVTKLNASGSGLVYSTYLGGTLSDGGNSIAVDGSGNAYITGVTSSTDFPTASPFQGDAAGDDAFVTKLNASGSGLVYSTYLGGNSSDGGYGIAVDDSGNAYVTGFTLSNEFPTVSPYQQNKAGSTDAFVTKFNALGSTLIYSTYLGGNDGDSGYDIAVDGSGNVYVTGYTSSTDFPTISPYQSDNAGLNDAFVTKFNALGSSLVYSTYLGGEQIDKGWGIVVDGSGNAYVTGETYKDNTTNFPTTTGSFKESNAGGYDGFMVKITAAAPEITVTDSIGIDNDLQMPFGDVLVGSSSTVETVTISNSGNANLNVSNIQLTGADTEEYSLDVDGGASPCRATALVIAALGNCTVTVTFSPTTTGVKTANLEITSDDSDKANVIVALSGGTTPEIDVTDSLGDSDDLLMPFGDVTEGANSVVETVTISNVGNAALNLSNIRLTSADTGEYSLDVDGGASPCGATALAIAASGNCTVTVTFSPTTTGSKTANLEITSDDSDEATVIVALSGTGLQSITNNPPDKPQLAYPTDGQQNLPTTVTFKWKQVTDPDGDTVTYDLYYCENNDPYNNCTSVQVAFLEEMMDEPSYAGFGYGGGLMLFGIFFAAGFKDRKRIGLLAMMFILAGTLLISCGGNKGSDSSGDDDSNGSINKTYTVTGLNSGTTYYWGVAAKDNQNAETQSDVWRFTTK